MIELIEMVEKHNTLNTINDSSLSFANRAASTMTARYVHEDFAYSDDWKNNIKNTFSYQWY